MSGSSFPRPFGRYTLLASLGRGGMGEVFAAVAPGGIAGVEKQCVVKTLHASFAADREAVARFLDEARVVIRLNHRNICSVFDAGVADGHHYIAMDRIRGRDLRAVWTELGKRGQSMDSGVAIHIVCEVLDALDYAHRLTDEQGALLHIVHRDVSPHNVMVSFEGEVKVIDFGLAASSIKEERTESNVVLGKIAYMSPEQARGEAIDLRADIFACAVMLYELLAGERFYEGVPSHLLTAVVGTGGHVPRRWRTVDEELRKVLERALSADLHRRTDAAGALAAELRRVAAVRDLHADPTAVRNLVRGLFQDAREAWEVSHASRAAAALAPTVEVQGVTVSQSATTSAASAPTSATASTDVEATTITPRRVQREEQRRGRTLVVGGIVVVALVVVSAVLASRASRPDAAGVDAGASVLDAASHPVEVAVADAGDPPAGTAVDAGSVPVEVATSDAGPRPTPQRRPSPRVRWPQPGARPIDIIDVVQRQCPALPCGRTALKAKDVQAAADECLRQCRRQKR